MTETLRALKHATQNEFIQKYYVGFQQTRHLSWTKAAGEDRLVAAKPGSCH